MVKDQNNASDEESKSSADATASADSSDAVQKKNIVEALYSPETADIDFEIPELGPELRPVDF